MTSARGSASGGGVLADIAASFSYDGTTSDLAAQFYVLERAGTQATPLTFTATTLPKDVADRLAVNALRFQDLSPWLQRAVLWDSGYVLVNDQGEVATIYTPCGSKSGMANVAVSVADYKSAGCTTQTCKLATGAAFARSKFCTGTQMGTVARCASSDFSAKTNSSMWATGGSKATVPEPNMKHHEWTDDGHDYLMYAIHTATPETDYGLCPDTTGSLIIPCVPLKGDKRKWCRPSPGRLVDEWLQSSNNLTAKTNTTGRATASVPAALSDMTKQFERLHKAGQEMPRLSTSLQIPADVTARLAKHSLSFITLPGLLQRALLWEMGYVLQQGTMALSTIYTRCNQTMADISLSESMMKQTTCRISSCNTSTTRFTDDKTCVADVTKIASCATGGVPSAGTGALWASGSAAPDITIVAYTFAGGGKTQQLMSIHATPQSFSTLCPASGSIAIPCAVYPASPSAQQNWCRPALGNNVEAWLKTTAAASNSSSSFNLLYLIPIVGSTLVLVAIVFWCYCCRERRKPKPTELDDVVLSPLANEPVRPTRPVRRPAEVPRITQLRRQSSNATSPGRFRPSSTDDERARRSSNNERAPGLADNDGARRSSNTKAARRSRPSEDRPRVPVGAGHDRDHRSAERQRAVRGTSEPRSSPPMKNSAASIAANILDFEPELVSRRIKLSSIEFLTRLARGSRCEVWLCEYETKNVVVKRLYQTDETTTGDIHDFALEIHLASKLRHPNIVEFYGVAWETGMDLCMVMEYMAKGDLQTFLKRDGDIMTWENDKMRVATGIARALGYLHSQRPAIIHRDVQSKNVLLTQEMHAKLVDFGVSRRRSNHDLAMTVGVGTPYWTAPEIMEGVAYTEKADIFSFGVLLTELDTTQLPYFDARNADGTPMRPFQIIRGVVQGTMRPSLSSTCPRRVADVAKACLKRDPNKRPTAPEILRLLESTEISLDEAAMATRRDMDPMATQRTVASEYML